MKILIAGDSYADSWQSKPCLKEFSWTSILQKKYKWTITNVGAGGSSLAYTYLKLKKSNLQSYDKVIVVITSAGRVLHNDGLPHFCNLNTAESLLKSIDAGQVSFLERDRKIALAIIGYYNHIYNHELDHIYYEALFKKIIELVPVDKLILINGCGNDKLSSNWHLPVKLVDITAYEIEDLGITLSDSQRLWGETNLHANHLSRENKYILVEEIKNLCENGTSSIAITDFKKVTADDFSLYYILKTETLIKQLDKRFFAKLKKLAK